MLICREMRSGSGSGCTGRKTRSPVEIYRTHVTALLRYTVFQVPVATFNRHPTHTRLQQEYFRSKVCLLVGRLRSVDWYKHLPTFRTNAVSRLGFLDPGGGGNKLLRNIGNFTCRHGVISQTSSSSLYEPPISHRVPVRAMRAHGEGRAQV